MSGNGGTGDRLGLEEKSCHSSQLNLGVWVEWRQNIISW